MTFSTRKPPPNLSKSEAHLFICRVCGRDASVEFYLDAWLFDDEELGITVGLCGEHDSDEGKFAAWQKTIRMRWNHKMMEEPKWQT